MCTVYHWSDGFMNNEPIRPVFRVLNLLLCHPVLLQNWEKSMTGFDGQTPHSLMDLYYLQLKNAFKPHGIRLYIIKYSRYRLLCLSVPNSATWTDRFIPSNVQYFPCLPSQLLSLVVYLHSSKITYLLVKTAVIFLPIRFYFPLHSGLYLSILSSNLPPESWCNNSLQSEFWNRLRPEMQ